MASPTYLNSQITDTVTQANTEVLGTSPAVAKGNLYDVTSQALSNAAHNATTNQQQATLPLQAGSPQSVSTLLAVDTASTGKAVQRIYH